MSKIFLGGTCAETTWREELIEKLEIPYFNPVVEDWTPECQAEEVYQKEVECDIHLYVITSAMIGVFSIAEVVESAMTGGKTTYFHVIPEGFNEQQMYSLRAVVELVKKYGAYAKINNALTRLPQYLNKQGD